MKKYVIAVIIGILLVPVGFYLYLISGHAPVATGASPLPFERFFARLAMHATMERELPKADAGPPTESDLVRGAQAYRQYCGVCHGFPNQQPTVIARGMYPHPPQFFHSKPVRSYDPSRRFRPASRKDYWKVKNGVRLTGMPGFGKSFSEKQLWEMSQFLENLRNLPPGAAAALEGRSEKTAPSAKPHTPLPQGGSHRE